MNFVKNNNIVGRSFSFKLREMIFYTTFVAFELFILSSGCGDKVTLPSPIELAEFNNTGPAEPVIDFEQLVETKIDSSSYRVREEEVIEITMPAILRVVTTEEPFNVAQDNSYICRISENGTINLPVIGEIEVKGKTLAQIESAIIELYYPEYILTRPSVFAKIIEYKTSKVSIVGAVQNPGIYSLRSDQMSLVNLLMEAGGIIDDGAALIRIVHSNNENQSNIQEGTSIINTGISRNIVSNPEANNNEDMQLYFEKLSTNNEYGILKLNYGDKILLEEYMDITDEIERLVFLRKAISKNTGISISNIEQKLTELIESFNSQSVILEKPSAAYYHILKEMENQQLETESQQTVIRKTETDTNNYISESIFASLEFQRKDDVSVINLTNENNYNKVFINAALDTQNYNPNNAYTSADEPVYYTSNMILNDENPVSNTSKISQNSESYILPVKGFNIPFADVVLQDGDKVTIERLTQPLFSVIGLVNQPGNFPYLPDMKYNLMQAIAFAGGLNQIAEPRYATVYRLKPDGDIVHATFEIINHENGDALADSYSIEIKPGDIVSIEHTPRTRTNVFLDRIFRINIGTYFNLNDAFNE